ncbi:PASTA domain-containing protein [Riemerella columbina]|uniref:PASTA domain-containing protein n=1 Tax=Riemerella columbina TaxID=103810 RepID=UPI00266FA41C|nr:PASTA domain-containing protein [Riemerella columbina]WKS95745.1 PASTA domain-containing protein [Riemerella columbina]
MFKSLFHWKVLLNLVIAIGVLIGLVWLTFRWLEVHTDHGKEVPVPNVVNMSMHNAIKVLDDAGLDYEIDSGKYDPKYKAFQVLQVYPSAGSRVKESRSVRLRVNPRTWAPVTVPDVLNRYKNTAFVQLERVGLKIGDTIYEPSIQPDAIIGMKYNGTPLKPGVTLPRFSVIDLVIGTGPRRNIAVPNVVGMTVAQAKQVIEQNYFALGLVEHEDGDNDDSDIVYYQDPAPGALRDQGMQVDIWATKKTLAEMQNKINELDQVYRVRTEPVSPVYEEPIYTPSEPVVVPQKPKNIEPTTEETPKPKPAPAPQPEKKEAPKPKAPETKPAAEKPAPKAKAEEKPKAKKIIIE